MFWKNLQCVSLSVKQQFKSLKQNKYILEKLRQYFESYKSVSFYSVLISLLSSFCEETIKPSFKTQSIFSRHLPSLWSNIPLFQGSEGLSNACENLADQKNLIFHSSLETLLPPHRCVRFKPHRYSQCENKFIPRYIK
jgi:hypothetical protein